MNLVHLVALLAVAQYLVFGMLVGRARGRYGIKAPAMTGHEDFERAVRVQMNTLELLAAFLPSLFIAAAYWSSGLVAALGAVYLVGRLVYQRAYVANPARREIGFALSMLPIMGLLVLALAGAVGLG